MNTKEKKTKKIKEILRQDVDYTIQNKAICFLPGDHTPKSTAGNSLLGLVQENLKRYGGLYYILLKVFAPVYSSRRFRRALKNNIDGFGKDSVILNIGSGPQVIQKRDDIINLDLFTFDSVDLVADVADLPLAEATVDSILNTALLEHVLDSQIVVNEMLRVLKPGGIVICYVPFIQPLHAAPADYQRWTMRGCRQLFAGYELVEMGIGAGPTSGFLWILQDWLALVFSFGSKKLHDLLFVFFMIMTAPMKLIDLVLVEHPKAEEIASGFYIVAKKPTSNHETTKS